MRLSFPPRIGYRWLYNKTLQNLTAEDSNTHDVAASVSQGSGYGLLGASAPSFTAPHSLTALAGWLSSPSSAGEELLQVHVVTGILLLTGFWSEGLSSLLAVGQRPLSVPCRMGPFTGQLTARQLASSEVGRGGDH